MRVLRRARATKRSSNGIASAGSSAAESSQPAPESTPPAPSWAPPPTWWSQVPAPSPPPSPPEPAFEQAIEALLVSEPAIGAASMLPPDDAPRAPEPPRSVDATPVDIIRVLEAVTGLCDRVVEYIEADRAERRLVVDALTRLTNAINAAPPAPGAREERVIGGSMPATGPDAGAKTVDLRESETRVEVRCRFGDRWVDGFEIFDVVSDEYGIRYRLKRRIDGVVLPELFLAADIRHMETFEELDATQPRRRYWSPT
jgi:hypothetical protein